MLINVGYPLLYSELCLCFIKRNKISIIYGKIDNINYDPPNIDISKFKIKKNKVFLFRENINKVSEVNIKFLKDLEFVKYKNMKLKVPKRIEQLRITFLTEITH